MNPDEEMLGKLMLAKGRALFAWLHELPQSERNEAVDIIAKFHATGKFHPAVLEWLKETPLRMYDAMEHSVTLASTIDKISREARAGISLPEIASYLLRDGLHAAARQRADDALAHLREKLSPVESEPLADWERELTGETSLSGDVPPKPDSQFVEVTGESGFEARPAGSGEGSVEDVRRELADIFGVSPDQIMMLTLAEKDGRKNG